MELSERGTKRVCQSCSGKYYDLNREPVLCPKCQTEFDPAAGLKLRSDTSYKAHVGRAKSVFGRTNSFDRAEAAPADDVEAAEDGEDKAETDEAVDEDGEAVEDVAELGNDSDDLAEIVETNETDER
jgi:uncharacterized protein (TIGR02300 family)